MFSILYIASFFTLILQSNAASKETLEKEQRILDRLLGPTKYDSRIKPVGRNETGPIVVHINTYIRGINRIDDSNMEYETQLTFRQTWTDPRLKYNKTELNQDYLTLTDPQRIWMPDIFFSNEYTGHFHNIITPNVLMRIFPDGKILYSIRISLKLSCPMNLKSYPFDRQICSIVFASYAYTTKDLVFMWKKVDPVQISKQLHLSKFAMEKFFTDYCTSVTNTGEYSCLKIDLVFKRQIGFYFLNVFQPTTCLVIISWISFWLDCRATTIRMILCATVLMCMVFVGSSIMPSIPAVSYVKAIDVWIGICFTFLLAAIVELAVVTRIMTKEKDRKSEFDTTEDNSIKPSETTGEDGFFRVKYAYLKNMFRKDPSSTIDIVSRVLFPVSFVLFSVIFFLSNGV